MWKKTPERLLQVPGGSDNPLIGLGSLGRRSINPYAVLEPVRLGCDGRQQPCIILILVEDKISGVSGTYQRRDVIPM
jgi:hypothetical protein